MGMFGNLFGGKATDYPALDPTTPAAAQLDGIRASLETLADKVHQSMEIIPAEQGAFVYIGKPPKNFGIAWVENGEVKNFKTLTEEHGVTQQELTALNNKLRAAYERHSDDPRYTMDVGGRKMVVIPSEGFEEDVKGIISTATH
jgi:hypothetical protein